MTERHVVKRPPFSDSGSVGAPMLYFDDAPAFGHANGIIKIALEATRLHANDTGEVIADRVLVAQLLMNRSAALALKAALDGALLLSAPPESEAKN
jgi:hypothetical protein